MRSATFVESRRRCAKAGILVFCVLAAGCNRGGLDLVPVEGVVKYKGAPVPKAGVMFVPEQGLPAMGVTNENGEFSLVTANQPGALVGEHQVSISKTETVAIQQRQGFPEYQTKYLVPQKYASTATSGLRKSVVDDDNYFEFELTAN
jgi:hypothetical protein